LSQRIALTSVILFVITVVTAATGYLREFVLARTFGAGTEMDAFYFSQALVQATHDLLFGAVLTATIVPLLHRREEGALGAAYDPARFTVTIAVTVGLSASAVAIAIRAALPYLIDLLSPKMAVAVREQCLALSSILVWLLPLNALMIVGVFVLNAHRRFIIAAAVYVFINVAFVVVLLLAEPVAGVNSLAIASLAGPAFVLPILGVSLVRMGLLRPLRPDFSKNFFAPIWRQSRPILLTLGIGSGPGLLMIAHLIVRGFAADNGQGSIAALGYAFRLYEVPLSLIANPAAVLMLPNIAIMYKAGRMADIGHVSRQTLLAGLVVLFPAAVVTWIGADLIVHVFLERGNFGADAARLTSVALRGFAPAIVGEGFVVVFYRLFYAIHRPSRAVVTSCAALLALVILLLLFGSRDFIAVPLALSAGFWIGAMTLVYFLVREFGAGSLPSLRSVSKWGACALIGVAAWKLADLHAAKTVWAELLPASVFTLAYCAAIMVLFADYRRILLAFLSAFASRLRLFL
jgi:putative peptidoglycan lipid II flippase